jgi:hypothetical protein
MEKKHISCQEEIKELESPLAWARRVRYLLPLAPIEREKQELQ